MRRSQIDGFVYNCVKKRQLMFLPCSRIGERRLSQKPENSRDKGSKHSHLIEVEILRSLLPLGQKEVLVILAYFWRLV